MRDVDDYGWSQPRKAREACGYDSDSMMVSTAIRHGRRIFPGAYVLLKCL